MGLSLPRNGDALERRAHALGTRVAWRRRAVHAIALAVFASAAASDAGAAAALRLEDPNRPCPGPICARPQQSTIANLAGFGLATGAILWVARRRDRRARGAH
jgi:hypothetical protein